MKIYFDPAGTIAGMRKLIQAASAGGAGGIVLFTCEDNGLKACDLELLARSTQKPLMGGVFPAVIHGGKAHRKGTVALGFPGRFELAAVADIGAAGAAIDGRLEKLADAFPGARTMLVLLNGASGHSTSFVRRLFDIFGLAINYVGGGTGFTDGRKAPGLFHNGGLIEDGAIVALSAVNSGVGVAHGWTPASEPLQATEVQGNRLKTINFEPAFKVYAEVVKEQTGVLLGPDNFNVIAEAHPFGIARINQEMIVREPLSVDPDGSIVCAGGIPQDSYISVMRGGNDSLIAAAAMAAGMARSGLPQGGPRAYLLMDCISRLRFMGPAFAEELARMAPEGSPSAGACTYGEIANSRREFLEFYTRTAVTAVLEDK